MSKKRAVVLAAGKGTRMKSELPKVLVPVRGRPMIEYVLDVLDACGVTETIVVVGYRADLVRQQLSHRSHLTFVEQTEQLGTGHAVMVCREVLAHGSGPVLVLTGDSPLVQQMSIEKLFVEFERTAPACLLGTAYKENPHGLGRIVRDAAGDFVAIVEERDATDDQRRITEVNMSTYLFEGAALLETLGRLEPKNAQNEYYLTDSPGLLRTAGKSVRALPVLMPVETLSINTMEELATVEQVLQSMASS